MTAVPPSPPPRSPLDRFIRRFQFASYLGAISDHVSPRRDRARPRRRPGALLFLDRASHWAGSLPSWLGWPAMGTAVAVGFFIAGFSLLIVVPVYNQILPTRVRALQGSVLHDRGAPLVHP